VRNHSTASANDPEGGDNNDASRTTLVTTSHLWQMSPSQASWQAPVRHHESNRAAARVVRCPDLVTWWHAEVASNAPPLYVAPRLPQVGPQCERYRRSTQCLSKTLRSTRRHVHYVRRDAMHLTEWSNGGARTCGGGKAIVLTLVAACSSSARSSFPWYMRAKWDMPSESGARE